MDLRYKKDTHWKRGHKSQQKKKTYGARLAHRRCGASGDTELFEKANNINGFQG